MLTLVAVRKPLVAVLIACLATACIFDDGSGYQGGGRRDSTPETGEEESTGFDYTCEVDFCVCGSQSALGGDLCCNPKLPDCIGDENCRNKCKRAN